MAKIPSTKSASKKTSTAAGIASPATKQVYVVGAGFSAGLGYPLVNDLLIKLWPKLNKDLKVSLRKVIEFHHPGFASSRATSFPNIETLLSEMVANEQLFEASRTAPGRFSPMDLEGVRKGLLLEITRWFHKIRSSHSGSQPDWLIRFARHVETTESVVISFNWDLVLDALLFDQRPANYGLDQSIDGPILLKPHGSLNWFGGTFGANLKAEKKILLHRDGESVYQFRHFRAPKGKLDYMPLIIPPVFNKDFAEPIFRDTWRRSVSELSRAASVTFLGYSLPDADLHARFILRCGFDNQSQGELLKDGTRSDPVGSAAVTIVNPDLNSARRIEGTVGRACKWIPTLVNEWAESNFVS